jgi:hypothetical protein
LTLLRARDKTGFANFALSEATQVFLRGFLDCFGAMRLAMTALDSM